MALALGSGGARGYAHLGVLEVLRERELDVVAIAGTSMGALVGALAAAGVDEQFGTWARSLTQRDVLRLLDPTISGSGAFRAERVLGKVSELLGGALIEDLPIPFTAVATDLQARREVWFQRGPADLAIRASIAIPSLITPVMINGRLLVDGGLMNPVPIEPTVASNADITLAVSLSGMRSNVASATPVKATSEPREEWGGRLRRGAAGLLETERVRAISDRIATVRRSASGRTEVTEPAAAAWGLEALPGDLGVRDLLNMSFDTMSALIARYRMASMPPDVLVTVPVNACRTMDFHRAGDLIAVGRRLTTEALEAAGY